MPYKNKEDAKANREKDKDKDKIKAKASREKNKVKRAMSYKAWYESNKDKRILYCKVYRESRTEIARATWLNYKYKLTIEEYNEMLALQNNSCASCDINQDQLSTNLCVDHNHTTFKNRGLLCNKCNTALGLFKDEQQNMLRAIDYIHKTSKTGFLVENKHRFVNLSMKETLIEKQKLIDSQNNKCAICKTFINMKPDAISVRPCFDHNHSTSEIRGALCVKCNTAIGMCEDNVSTLKNMIKYIQNHS
jgi:hypothetical protein